MRKVFGVVIGILGVLLLIQLPSMYVKSSSGGSRDLNVQEIAIVIILALIMIAGGIVIARKNKAGGKV